MKSLIILAVLCICISLTVSQSVSCANRVITNVGTLANSITAPSDLQFCKQLIGKQVCCSKAEIDAIGTKMKAVFDEQKKKATENDNKLKDVSKKMKDLSDQMKGAAKEMKAAKVPSGSRFLQTAVPTDIQAKIDSLKKEFENKQKGNGRKITENLGDNNAMKELEKKMGSTKDIAGEIKKKQKGRSKCMKHMMKTQARMMCMSCEADQSKFTANGELSLHSDTCQTTLNECWDSFQANKKVSAFKGAGGMFDKLKKGAQDEGSSLKELANFQGGKDSKGQQISKADMQAKFDQMKTKLQAAEQTSTSSVQSKGLPAGCNSQTDCKPMCQRLLKKTGVDMNEAQDPGVTVTTTITNTRILQSGTSFSSSGYQVDTVVSGAETTVSTFPEDPAGVDATISANVGANGTIIKALVASLTLLYVILN